MYFILSNKYAVLGILLVDGEEVYHPKSIFKSAW
jgi:hypothetical protein